MQVQNNKSTFEHTKTTPNALTNSLDQLTAPLMSILNQLRPQLKQRQPSHTLIMQRGIRVGVEFLVPLGGEQRVAGRLQVRDLAMLRPHEERPDAAERAHRDRLQDLRPEAYGHFTFSVFSASFAWVEFLLMLRF